MDDILLVSGVAFIITLFLTPLTTKIAHKIGAVDVPKDNRRMHTKPMPILGGVPLYIGFVIAMMIKDSGITNQEIGIILGGAVIVASGVWDDLRPMGAKTKFMFQVIAAGILIVFGTSINVITNPVSGSIEFLNVGFLGIPLTMLWVIGVTNAFNFIDGLDGLSAGIGVIAAVTMVIIAVMNGRYEAALVTAILAGALLGVIPFNFYPASIFMGDAGAMFTGFVLAAASIMGAIKSATTFAVAIPILALGLPIYDTLFAIIRRTINGKSFAEADKGHVHHRMVAMGMSQRTAVLWLYLFSSILGAASIFAMSLSNRRAYFFAAVIIVIIFLICLKWGMFKKEKKQPISEENIEKNKKN